MNLCSPDRRKACAACCGLYNVRDGTRSALTNKLADRTLLFHNTERSVEAILEFQAAVHAVERDSPLDEAIHVCEFTGFVDSDNRVPGCLLHPSACGNRGVDLRGLCHYGSMACKAFFCPAWELAQLPRFRLVSSLIDDWHLYGLVMTDIDFVQALFSIIHELLGEPVDPYRVTKSPACGIFTEMLSWKDSWPFKGNSRTRRSRYYVKECPPERSDAPKPHMARLLESLRFTFDIPGPIDGAEHSINRTVERFVDAYRS